MDTESDEIAAGKADGTDARAALSEPPPSSPVPGSVAGSRGRYGGRHAALVAAGIFLSRIAGLVRERAFSHFFGLSDAGDVLRAAFRIPNLLQNLFGEGVLSASFIPVYARLLADGEREEANRVAGAVFALLALVVSVLVLAGILAAPLLVGLIAPGFEGAKRVWVVDLVRIVFPGTGILVLSAWCLGILNSHRRFFLSYAAPIAWNAIMIAALVGFGGRMGDAPLAAAVAWASVAGAALQFLVQLPLVLRLARGLRPRLTLAALAAPGVRRVARGFVPVFLGRGVIQISAMIDTLIASFLPAGAVAALTSAQTLYLLPVSLFGMSVSASELALMSGAAREEGAPEVAIRARLEAGLRRIAFFVVPSAVAFVTLGDVVASVVYQTGRFGRADAVYVWAILAGSGIGLLATTWARLYASTLYATGDTRTPLRAAVVRVAASIGCAYVAALHFPRMLGVEARWGAAGITLAASLAGFVELALLRRWLRRRIGEVRTAGRPLAAMAASAAVAAVLGRGTHASLAHLSTPPLIEGIVTLGVYGTAYFALAAALHLDESSRLVRRMLRR